MKKVGIISLGCPRNLVDSQGLLNRLAGKGYKITDINEADIGLVNTCSFIDEARKESVDAILDMVELKKEGRLRKIIVSGCLPELYKEKLASELKEVDAFVGRLSLAYAKCGDYLLTPKHFAYLKISEGCEHRCSFCVIPKIKGKLKSRSISSIVDEVRLLDRRKVFEVNVIGQDISVYGLDLYKKIRLAELLRKIASTAKNIRWVRLLYLHPKYLTRDLLNLVKEEPKICKYLDLPLQHINDKILKAMNRRISRKEVLKLLENIRKIIPGAAIRTSLLVGFPGETQNQFDELLNFVREQKFERLGVFKYSREESTKAFNYPGQIPERIKEERFRMIMEAQAEISSHLNKKFLAQEVEVLIDEKSSGGLYLGRLSLDAPEIDGCVYVKSLRTLRPGQFVKVKITDTYEYDLAGEINESAQ